MEDFILETALYDAVAEIMRLSLLKGDLEYKGVDISNTTSEGIEKASNEMIDILIDNAERKMNLK